MGEVFRGVWNQYARRVDYSAGGDEGVYAGDADASLCSVSGWSCELGGDCVLQLLCA